MHTHIPFLWICKAKEKLKKVVNGSVKGIVVKIQVRKREKVEIKTRNSRNMSKFLSQELIK